MYLPLFQKGVTMPVIIDGKKISSEIKEEWAPPQKTNLLWKVMKIKPIGLVINGFRNLKQQLG